MCSLQALGKRKSSFSPHFNICRGRDVRGKDRCRGLFVVATTALGRLTHCPPPLRRIRAKKGQIRPKFSISGAKTARKVMKTEEWHSHRSPLYAPLAVRGTPVITSIRSGKIARQSDTSDSNRGQKRPKIDINIHK